MRSTVADFDKWNCDTAKQSFQSEVVAPSASEEIAVNFEAVGRFLAWNADGPQRVEYSVRLLGGPDFDLDPLDVVISAVPEVVGPLTIPRRFGSRVEDTSPPLR